MKFIKFKTAGFKKLFLFCLVFCILIANLFAGWQDLNAVSRIRNPRSRAILEMLENKYFNTLFFKSEEGVIKGMFHVFTNGTKFELDFHYPDADETISFLSEGYDKLFIVVVSESSYEMSVGGIRINMPGAYKFLQNMFEDTLFEPFLKGIYTGSGQEKTGGASPESQFLESCYYEEYEYGDSKGRLYFDNNGNLRGIVANDKLVVVSDFNDDVPESDFFPADFSPQIFISLNDSQKDEFMSQLQDCSHDFFKLFF